jgi:hypothetical protein
MNTQPEALRLADELNAVSETGADPDVIQESATELRRLHSVNADLLEALKISLDAFEDLSKNHGISYITEIVDARAAIAKATGETK